MGIKPQVGKLRFFHGSARINCGLITYWVEKSDSRNVKDWRPKVNREPTKKKMADWQHEMNRNGRKRMAARVLLKAFGLQKRTPNAIERVTHWLEVQNPPVFAHGLKYVGSLDEPIFLSNTEEKQIGRLVEKEQELMERFPKEIMPQLHLTQPQKGFRPQGSRDELDYLCKDEQKRSVVVEIKRKDGERRVVEQVIRYIRLLRNTDGIREPRGLIITGIADISTRRALEELEPQYHIDWFVYGIDENDNLRVQQIDVQPARPSSVV